MRLVGTEDQGNLLCAQNCERELACRGLDLEDERREAVLLQVRDQCGGTANRRKSRSGLR